MRADLPTSQQFLVSTLDALSANIAILDEAGTIVGVNESWRCFADDNGLKWPDCGVGRNYLAVIEASSSGDSSDEAVQAARGMRELLAGRRDRSYLEYPCHGPDERRWFEMRATRFNISSGSWLVVAHEDITSRKLAEQALQETRELAVAARYEEQERLREAERRRDIAEGLGDVLAALNSNKSLEEVLDLIATQARRLFDTRAVGIYSLEAEVGASAYQSGLATKHSSQHRGC